MFGMAVDVIEDVSLLIIVGTTAVVPMEVMVFVANDDSVVVVNNLVVGADSDDSVVPVAVVTG